MFRFPQGTTPKTAIGTEESEYFGCLRALWFMAGFAARVSHLARCGGAKMRMHGLLLSDSACISFLVGARWQFGVRAMTSQETRAGRVRRREFPSFLRRCLVLSFAEVNQGHSTPNMSHPLCHSAVSLDYNRCVLVLIQYTFVRTPSVTHYRMAETIEAITTILGHLHFQFSSLARHTTSALPCCSCCECTCDETLGFCRKFDCLDPDTECESST